MNPDIANAWDDEYGDRVNKIVFIGQNMDKEAITKPLTLARQTDKNKTVCRK